VIISSRGKEICQTKWHTWGNFKVTQGSLDYIPHKIAGYYDEQNAIPGDWKKL